MRTIGTSGIHSSAEQQSLISREAEALDLDGLAIFRMFAVYKLADEFPYHRMDIFWNQAGSVFFGREGLKLPNVKLGLIVHKEQLPGTS